MARRLSLGAVAAQACRIAHHAGDAQPVIVKHTLPAGRLRRAVRVQLPPLRQRRLVAEKRERQQFTRLTQAAEAFDGNETVDRIEQGPQRGGQVKILLAPFGRWAGLQKSRRSCHFSRAKERDARVQRWQIRPRQRQAFQRSAPRLQASCGDGVCDGLARADMVTMAKARLRKPASIMDGAGQHDDDHLPGRHAHAVQFHRIRRVATRVMDGRIMPADFAQHGRPQLWRGPQLHGQICLRAQGHDGIAQQAAVASQVCDIKPTRLATTPPDACI